MFHMFCKFPPCHRSLVPNSQDMKVSKLWFDASKYAVESLQFHQILIHFVNRIYMKQRVLIGICFPGYYWNKGNTSLL